MAEAKKKDLFHVFVGKQPVVSLEDQELAESIARSHKTNLLARGCDLSLPEHTVRVTTKVE